MIGVGIIGAATNATAQTTSCPQGHTCYAIPMSGLPSVTVNPNAMLIPGQATSLSDLITYNPGDPQCNFVDTVTGALVGTGPCSIAYSVLEIYPNSAYAISGAYVNGLGEIIGAVGGTDPSGLFPDYAAITLTANSEVAGTTSLSGLINPQTATQTQFGSVGWSYGPIDWNGSVQIGANSCLPPASVASFALAPLAATSLASAPAGSCPICPPTKLAVITQPDVLNPAADNPIILGKILTTGGITLEQEAQACGYTKFNFMSQVNHDPTPPMDVYGNTLTVPYSDPPQGGYYKHPESQPPFYYNFADLGWPICPSNAPNNCVYQNGYGAYVPIRTADSVTFRDEPANPNFKKPKYQNEYLGFHTMLVGIRQDGTRQSGAAWDWISTFNGTKGGADTRDNLGPVDPKSGTGGVGITSINGVPMQSSLSSGQSCNGIFGGTFNGNVIVSADQSCRFTNYCEIAGDVTVNGGSLDLECVVDGNVTANGGNFYLGPSAVVKGNFQISQGSAVIIDGAAINGNLRIRNLSATSSQNSVCGAQIKGNVEAQTNASLLLIGGTASRDCAGNKISGNLTASNNTATVQIDYNTISGNLTVNGDSATTDVSGNSIGGNLECANDPNLTHVASNMVKGHHEGQCAAFP
jgi:cytoskeletal protein CcmA (bactofilin family)